MKHVIPVFCTLLGALPLCAATELTVNKPLETTLIDAQTVTILETPKVAIGMVPVLTANILFTLPDETPSYDDVASEKLAIAVDTDGTILIADGATKDWVESTTVATTDEAVAVRAEGFIQDDKLYFKVTLNGADPIIVCSPSSNIATLATSETAATLSTIELAGEGTVSELTLAVVDTAIIPGSETQDQDATLVSKYVTWLNDTTKGAQLPEGETCEAIANAFAMNVGGTPTLTVTALDPVAKTITLKATYALENAEAIAAPLDEINGKLYFFYADSLTGTPTVDVVSLETLTVNDDDTFTLPLPEGATFVKAAVSLETPAAESL